MSEMSDISLQDDAFKKVSIENNNKTNFDFTSLDNTKNGLETGGLHFGDKERSTISILIILEQTRFIKYFSGGEAK